MKRALPVLEDHQFRPADFVGGEPVLDFANTVTGRDERPRDWLSDFGGLLRWGEAAGLVDFSSARSLAAEAAASPARAAKALGAAKTLREALFDICSAIVRGAAADREALAALHKAWARAAARQTFRWKGGRLEVTPVASPANFDLIADIIAVGAVSWLGGTGLHRLRMCDGRNCAWLFMDTSKAGRRRWCDMATCGNTAKAHRFAQKRRGGQGAGPAG